MITRLYIRGNMKKTIYSIESKNFVAWLRQQRENANLTQRQLGALLNVHHSIVGKIETGERRLDVVEFVEYCLAIEADPNVAIDVIRAVRNKR